MFGTPGTDERIDKTIDREGRAVRKEEDRPQVAQGISYPAASFGAPLDRDWETLVCRIYL